MAWIFTDTITHLPWYYIKVEVIADCGTTGTLSATNGGYVMDIGDLSQAIDTGSGAYEPGQIDISLKNLGSVFSTNVFNAAIGQVELRIWVSYDAGTTYEIFFAGFIDTYTRKYSERDTSDAGIRVYNVQAYEAVLTLRDVATTVLQTTPPANLVTETSVAGRGIDADFVYVVYDQDYVFAYVHEIITAILKNIPFIAGATAPTIALNITDGGMILDSAGGITAGFADAGVVWTIPVGMYTRGYSSFGNPSPSDDIQKTCTIYTNDNLLTALREILESFLLIGTPKLTESGGAYTYTFYIEPFNSIATASAGALGVYYKKDGAVTRWYDGLEINTTNIPAVVKSDSSYGGKTREFKNRFMTCPDLGVAGGGGGLYYLSSLINRVLKTFVAGTNPPPFQTSVGGALLYVWSGTNFVNCKKIKLRSFQTTAYPTSTTDLDFCWYGVQRSIEWLLKDNADTALLSRNGRSSLSLEYKTLKGTAMWDLRPSVYATIDTLTYRFYKTKKSILNNKTAVEALEEA